MSKTKYSVDTDDFYQNAPCGFLTCDGEGRIVGINNTLLKWTGRERAEVEGLATLSSLLTVGSRIFAETHIMPLLKMQGYVNEVSLEFKGKDNTALPCLLNAYCDENSGGDKEHYKLTIIDYTTRKRFEQELIEARKAAETSEARLREVNEDLERFAYIASHDLQAPLNNLNGLLKVVEIKELMVKDVQAEQVFEMIKRSTHRMTQMISDLLEYRRLDGSADATELVSLNVACAEAIDNLSDHIRSSKAKFQIDEEMPHVRGVHSQWVRLFQNLFSNAIKYRSEAPPKIQVKTEKRGDRLRISVADNGRGFDPADAETIFGFMQRLEPGDGVEGTGVGLTACRRIVEMHGGRIWAESKPGEGSTFFIELTAE